MKALIVILFCLVSAHAAFVDMSDVVARANDLGMNTKDYVYAMATAGTALGFIFGLFLWKVR